MSVTNSLTSPASLTLVIGATGKHGSTGAHVVKGLISAGRPVRALVRRLDERSASLKALGAEVVVGDLRAVGTLNGALQNTEAAYFTYPVGSGVVEAAANFAAAARNAESLQHIVVMSMAIAHPQSPSLIGRAQWLAEEILQWAGLPCTILRIAALFHENIALLHSRSIQKEAAFRNSFGLAPVPWISGADAAQAAVSALLHPERFQDFAIHYPPGSELLTHNEVAQLLSIELGRPITFEAVEREAWRTELLQLANDEASGVNVDMASHISAIGAALARPGQAPVRPPDKLALQQLTGRESTSMREFIKRESKQFITD